MTSLRNSNPLFLHLISLVGAFVLSVFIFLIFPFSHSLSVREPVVQEVQKKTFVKLYQPKLETTPQTETLKNIRVKDIKSSMLADKIKIEIPASDFAKIAVAGAGNSSVFGLQNFELENLAGVENFDMKIFEISELDTIPQCKKRGALQYPRKLFEHGIEGEVRLIVFINEDGTIELDSVESFTHEEFLLSAKKSLKTMLYDVPTYNGEPARARFVLPITFKINNK